MCYFAQRIWCLVLVHVVHVEEICIHSSAVIGLHQNFSTFSKTKSNLSETDVVTSSESAARPLERTVSMYKHSNLPLHLCQVQNFGLVSIKKLGMKQNRNECEA